MGKFIYYKVLYIQTRCGEQFIFSDGRGAVQMGLEDREESHSDVCSIALLPFRICLLLLRLGKDLELLRHPKYPSNFLQKGECSFRQLARKWTFCNPWYDENSRLLAQSEFSSRRSHARTLHSASWRTNASTWKKAEETTRRSLSVL